MSPIEWDGLLAKVAQLIRRDPTAFTEAGQWLDFTFDDSAGLRWWAREHGDPPPEHFDHRTLRLYAAFETVRDYPPSLRFSGLDDPALWSRRVLLLVALLTDPAASEYASGLTLLAELSFDADVFGRGRIESADDLRKGKGMWPGLVENAVAVLPPRRLHYGSGTLIRYGFIGPEQPPIQPGVFIIGIPEGAFQFRPVPEGASRYCGVALDRPETGTDGVMIESDLPPLEGPHLQVGRMGHFAWTDGHRQAIGDVRADRAWETAAALERLLERFHADPRHPDTGFKAEDVDSVPLVRGEIEAFTADGVEPDRELWEVEDIPRAAVRITTRRGWIYSGQQRSRDKRLDHLSPAGFAGNLTLSGQIECLSAVLRDRLGELLGNAPPAAMLPAMRSIAGRKTPALDWTEAERRDLELVRGELWAWSAQPQTGASRQLVSASEPLSTHNGAVNASAGLHGAGSFAAGNAKVPITFSGNGMHDEHPHPMPSGAGGPASHVSEPAHTQENEENPKAGNIGGAGKRQKRVAPATRRKADRVRELLSAEAPYEGTKSDLAAAVGYTHSASLSNVKHFDNLWNENQRKLAEARAQRQRRMSRPAD